MKAVDSKKKMYELVIFDLDGTLLDTTEGIVNAISYTIEAFGLEKLSCEKLLKFIGPPVQESFIREYGVDSEKAQELAECFRDYYKEKTLFGAKAYDGIYELLDHLSENEVKIAVATYKREDYAVKLLKHFGFDRYSEMLYGADNFNKLTKADIIIKCIEKAGIKDKKKVLMVGDSIKDKEGADHLGIDFIGVTYGFGFQTKQEIRGMGASGACKEPLEILKYVINR